jgi:hypothetical protein
MMQKTRWQTHVFSGATVDAATAALDAWLNADKFSTVSQPILQTSSGVLHMYLSHCPMPSGHQIYVTALMDVAEEPA